MRLAAAELQDCSRLADDSTCIQTRVWIGARPHHTSWIGDDGCGILQQSFWACGEPHSTGSAASYSPPGLAGTTGWHAQSNHDGPFRPLCQLSFCYRPDCQNVQDSICT